MSGVSETTVNILCERPENIAPRLAQELALDLRKAWSDVAALHARADKAEHDLAQFRVNAGRRLDEAEAKIAELTRERDEARVIDRGLQLPDDNSRPWLTQESFDGLWHQLNEMLEVFGELMQIGVPNELPTTLAVAKWIVAETTALRDRATRAEVALETVQSANPDDRYRTGMMRAAEIAVACEWQQEIDHGMANTGVAGDIAAAIRAEASRAPEDERGRG